VLTAWANDQSYHEIFSRELWNIGRPDDALIALSCSGTSLNISMVLGARRDERVCNSDDHDARNPILIDANVDCFDQSLIPIMAYLKIALAPLAIG
jgi:hypothetical protein